MASTIQGHNLCLFVLSGSSNKVCIALATSCSVDISMDLREVTSKDSYGNWLQQSAGKLSWTASSDNLYTADETMSAVTYSYLVNLMIARTPVTVTFAPVTSTDAGAPQVAGSTILTGSALINTISLTAPNDDTVTYSVSLTGVGALTRS